MSYPSVEEVIEANLLVLGLIGVKKADRHEVLSRQKISLALERCREVEGNLYYKAAVLAQGLVSAHAFASGNRRTAFFIVKEFVVENGGKFAVSDDPSYAKVMQAIREGRHSLDEISEWIENGKISKA